MSAISCIKSVGGTTIICLGSPTFSEDIFTVQSLSFHAHATETTPGFTVAPGKYELIGNLDASASAGYGVPGVDAESLFFSTFETFGEYQAVPEPSTLILTGAGILGLFGYGWQRRKR